MQTKTVLAALTAVLAFALLPAFASADGGSAVQADLSQLSTDVKALHDTLLPDLAAVTAAAQKADKTGLRAAVQKFRGDRRAAWKTVREDRHQLRVDLKAANDPSLKDTVKAAVAANQALLKEVRQAARQALAAAIALRGSSSG